MKYSWLAGCISVRQKNCEWLWRLWKSRQNWTSSWPCSIVYGTGWVLILNGHNQSHIILFRAISSNLMLLHTGRAYLLREILGMGNTNSAGPDTVCGFGKGAKHLKRQIWGGLLVSRFTETPYRENGTPINLQSGRRRTEVSAGTASAHAPLLNPTLRTDQPDFTHAPF